MIKTAVWAAATMLVLAGAIESSAQTVSTQAKPVVQTFEHYEAIRVALSGDKLADVAPHAKLLLEQVPGVGGEAAKKAAAGIAGAKTLDEARTHFGDLSTVLVPLFQAEAIPGTTAYMCSMKKKPWVQKGDKVENPYYGQSMLTCGSLLPAKGK